MNIRGKNGHGGLRGGSTNPDCVIDFQAILPPALPNHKVLGVPGSGRGGSVRGKVSSGCGVRKEFGLREGEDVGSRLTNGHYFDSISHSRSFRRNVSKGREGLSPFPSFEPCS